MFVIRCENATIISINPVYYDWGHIFLVLAIVPKYVVSENTTCQRSKPITLCSTCAKTLCPFLD